MTTRHSPPGFKAAPPGATSAAALFSSSLRSGKWTTEEEAYAQALMREFKAGALMDIPEGTSMRGFLAKRLKCFPKRYVLSTSKACLIVVLLSLLVGLGDPLSSKGDSF